MNLPHPKAVALLPAAIELAMKFRSDVRMLKHQERLHFGALVGKLPSKQRVAVKQPFNCEWLNSEPFLQLRL
jgi:hypothetical protein